MEKKYHKLTTFFQKTGVLADKPNIWKPLLILSFLYTLFYGITIYWTEINQTYDVYLIDEEQENAFLNTEAAKPTRIAGFINATIFSFFKIPFFSLIGAFFTWVLVHFFQENLTFRKSYSLHLACSVILILDIFCQMIYHFIFPESPEAPFHLGFFIPTTGLLAGALQVINLFDILYFVVLLFGIRIVTKLNWLRASFVTLFFFAVIFFFHFSRFALASTLPNSM